VKRTNNLCQTKTMCRISPDSIIAFEERVESEKLLPHEYSFVATDKSLPAVIFYVESKKQKTCALFFSPDEYFCALLTDKSESFSKAGEQ
jgi:hypothetical protein